MIQLQIICLMRSKNSFFIFLLKQYFSFFQSKSVGQEVLFSVMRDLLMILPTRPVLSSRIRQKSSERIFPLKRQSEGEKRTEVWRGRVIVAETQVSFNRKLWAETKCPFRDTQNTLYTHTHTRFHNSILFFSSFFHSCTYNTEDQRTTPSCFSEKWGSDKRLENTLR